MNLQWCDVRVPPIWEAVAPFLESALPHGGYRDWGIEDIYRMAVEGHIMVLALVDEHELVGAGVVGIDTSPKRRVLNVHLLGTRSNTFDRWGGLLGDLKEMARVNGCNAVSGTGRPGWARRLGADRETRVWECDL